MDNLFLKIHKLEIQKIKRNLAKKLTKDVYNMYNGHKNMLRNSENERIKTHVNLNEITEGNIEQKKQFFAHFGKLCIIKF